MKINKMTFGIADNKNIDLFELTNNSGISMSVTNYGGIITKFNMPDKIGNSSDITLGFNDLQSYINDSPYFGCIVGRYGNRIGNAKFSIDGTEYNLNKNDGDNNLHGGLKGFDKVIWNAKEVQNDNAIGIEFSYLSINGEEGFPGNLFTLVTYWLNNNNELKIEYKAETDKTTIVNLTNHAYWNLAGENSGNILNHILEINSDNFTPIDETLIPTGEIKSVKNTPMDFTSPKIIGKDIEADYDQLKIAGGFDHNWVINGNDNINFAARVSEPNSGRVMEVHTSEPGIQFYTGNFIDGTLVGKSGTSYRKRDGLCLETQHYPDSPNKPDFPSTILKPGEVYKTTTIHKFRLLE